ncbi:PREDICTED: trithorax group protein osa-like [Camelina sativa]|uniref:Trithorax group protein osa-like n=1 Tax=Camelina sativa TaxID=90675 RepID=A0ABM0V619_CAMSA|nr:PREDICTED: trithorax group protein osa-like [Camelina sativa]
MDIAEKRVSEKDYNGAKKFVNKAQVLYPNIDGLQQVLMMIDVYISATNKINGEADWYGVLGVDPLADDEALKRQYKKLALLLHPDKNKFKGAEGAFKLVSQAWCLLSNKVKRSGYDQKRKSKDANPGMQKPPNPTHKPAPHNGNENARGGVDPSARATSDHKPASGMPKQPNPPKPAASSNGNQNARGGVDPSAGATSNHKPASGMPKGPKPPNPHKPASHSGNQNARGGVDPSDKATSDHKPTSGMAKPPNSHKPATSSDGYQNARGGVDPSAKATSDHKPASGMPEPPNPHKPAASSNGNQNARGGLDPSAGATSNHKPACGMPNTQKPSSSSGHQNARDRVDLSPKPSCYKPAPASAPADSSKQHTDSMLFWTMCNRCTTQYPYLTGFCHIQPVHCRNCGQVIIATQVVKPVNCSSSPQQQQNSAQNKATNKSINGASASVRNPSPSAAQKTPQGSAKSQATNQNTNGTFFSGRVSSPRESVVRPVNRSSFPTEQQHWSVQNKATNKSTNEASSSTSAAPKPPQASAKSRAANKNTNGASSSQRVSSPSVSATVNIPQWNCSVSVTANSGSIKATNQAQEILKRVHGESHATAGKVLKKPRVEKDAL